MPFRMALLVDPRENLLFLNSGADQVLAISSQGRVVRETAWIEDLDPGAANSIRRVVDAFARECLALKTDTLVFSQRSQPGSLSREDKIVFIYHCAVSNSSQCDDYRIPLRTPDSDLPPSRSTF